jgi:hypothetical protein
VVIYGDLTRANPGSIDGVLTRVPGTILKDENFHVVLFEEQQQELTYDVKKVLLPTGSDVGDHIQQLVKKALVNTDNSVVVVSFNSYVIRECSKLDEGDGRVRAAPWGRLTALLSTRPSSVDQSALELLVEILKERGATSSESGLLKSAIRPLLMNRDRKFSRAEAGPAFISSLVASAVRQGLVESDHGGVSERIWLRAGSQASRFQPPPPAKSPARAWDDSNAVPVRIVSAPAPAPAVQKQVEEDPFKSALRKAGLGPFPNFREQVYDKIAEFAGEGKHTSAALIRKAVDEVSKQHPDHKNFSWALVAAALLKLFNRAPVLVAQDGSHIVPSLRHLSTVVVGVKDNWRVLVDRELILAILEAGCAVSMYDFPQLAGTLYLNRQDENIAKIEALINSLSGDNKIRFEDDDRAIVRA